ncbi:uncharacterized protein LOC135367343 [Ornithodoros turicata]|uniref:uncharacterized protein LOC135367343 n=1 Tax=Ornithodoros turicata TaxID=34597 RepID=UPI00313969B9
MKLLYVMCLLPVIHGRNIHITAATEPVETNSKGQRVQYGCHEERKLSQEHRGNIPYYPHKCRYYCNRGSVPILYGYFEESTPCWDSVTKDFRSRTGTCVYSRGRKPSVWCDTNQTAVTSPPEKATTTKLPC